MALTPAVSLGVGGPVMAMVMAMQNALVIKTNLPNPARTMDILARMARFAPPRIMSLAIKRTRSVLGRKWRKQ
jgi:hypothetical protein